MAQRMLCTDCLRTDVPDTAVEGSDRLEILAWCCFALPGLLYCAWRHAARRKLCAHCGGGELIREARAAAARIVPSPAPRPPRSLGGAAPVRWPLALQTPRERLHTGAVATALVFAPALVWLGGAARLADPATASLAAQLLLGLCATWLIRQLARIARERAASAEAWDQHGRPLHIELV